MKIQIKEDVVSKKGLRKGQVYNVISISINQNQKKFLYRIIDSEGTPALYENHLFDIIDNKLDSDWIISFNEEFNVINIMPSSISYKGFWEDYFNDEDDAVKIFNNRFG
jgi:hypothetical protein